MTKKSFVALAAAVVLFASCEKKEGMVLTHEQTVYKAISVVYPEDDLNKEGEASMASYKIQYDLVASTCGIMCNDLKVNGSTLSYATNKIKMDSYNYTIDNISYSANVAMEDKNVGVGDVKVTDWNFFLTDAFYDFKINALGVTNNYGSNIGLYLQYVLNDKYDVKTFMRDTYYCGKTVTTYPSKEGMQTFENENIKYRVVVDLDKKKADVVLYDAQFAPPAPSIKVMILHDLDITYFDKGFQLSGQNIVPEVVEGEAATPYENFTFNQFSLKTASEDLMNVKCEYTVATVFKGSFSGKSSRVTRD